jgi:hypothetical protein
MFLRFGAERAVCEWLMLKKNLFVDKIETKVCKLLVFLTDSVKILNSK